MSASRWDDAIYLAGFFGPGLLILLGTLAKGLWDWRRRKRATPG